MIIKTSVDIGCLVYFIHESKVKTGVVKAMRIAVSESNTTSEVDIKDADSIGYTREEKYVFKTRKERIKSL